MSPDPVTEDWRERAVEAGADSLLKDSLGPRGYSFLRPIEGDRVARRQAENVLTAIESDLGPLAPISETGHMPAAVQTLANANLAAVAGIPEAAVQAVTEAVVKAWRTGEVTDFERKEDTSA